MEVTGHIDSICDRVRNAYIELTVVPKLKIKDTIFKNAEQLITANTMAKIKWQFY